MEHCAEHEIPKNSSQVVDLEFEFCDYTQRLIVATLLALWSFIAVLDNSIVILAVVLSKRLRTPTNVFIVNLSVADLLTGFFFAWQVPALVAPNGWPLPGWLCSVVSVGTTTGVGCSIHSLAFIALNRLLLVTKPLSVYQSVYTRRKMTIMVILTWLIPLLTASLPGIFGLVELGYDFQYKFCTFVDRNNMTLWYDFIIVFTNYPIPLIILIGSYYQIYRHIKRHSARQAAHATNAAWKTGTGTRQQSGNQLQMEITKNTFYIVCAFILCLTPYSVCILVDTLKPAVPYAVTVLLLNSWINPIIYATKHPHFKTVFRSIFLCKCTEIPEAADFIRAIRAKSSVDFTCDLQYEKAKVTTLKV